MSSHGSNSTGPRRTRWWLLGLTAFVVLVPAIAAVLLINREPAEEVYVPFAVAADGTAIDVGASRYVWGYATDVNASGLVAGTALATATGGQTHAVLWHEGAMIDLGAPGVLVALNNAGQAVGTRMDPTAAGWEPFLWTAGVSQVLVSDLGPLYSASDIDERGRVVGEIRAAPRLYAGALNTGTVDASTAVKSTIGVLWESGKVTLLETVDAMLTRSVRINESGTVLGQGRVKGGSYADHVLLWQAGSITDLGVGFPIAMNDRGQVVLEKQPNDDQGQPSRCYVWEAGSFTLLDGEDGTNLRGYDINESGVVAGQVEDRAALWQNGRITKLGLRSKNSCAYAISDAGEVAGMRQK
jgi:probable HAF family extracellular repeat protein